MNRSTDEIMAQHHRLMVAALDTRLDAQRRSMSRCAANFLMREMGAPPANLVLAA